MNSLKLYQREIKDDYGNLIRWVVEYRNSVYAITSDLSMAKRIYELLASLK